MKKTALLIALILVFCLAFSACDKKLPKKEAKTIEINSVEDLKKINNYLGDRYSLYTFELKKDLDLQGQNWTPIGSDNANSFRGVFNGNGHTISNLTIQGWNGYEFVESVPYSNAGLFGYIYGATIKDLNIKDFNISFIAESDYLHIGGLAGYAYGDNVISNISVSGQINIGTSFYYEQKSVLMQVTCEQMQYLGGIIGYAAGVLDLQSSAADAAISNYVASRGPKYDHWTGNFVYEKDENGKDTDKIQMEVTREFDSSYYPAQAFLGGAVGYVKGNGEHSQLLNIDCSAVITEVYAKSAYLGGLFGRANKSIINNASFSGELATRVFVKGVSGGIAGLLDDSRLTNSSVDDTTITLNVTGLEYQAYTTGGLVGYANDFSLIMNCAVNNTKILSDLPNRNMLNEINNFPVIGGIAGTVRDSSIFECEVNGGGVFRKNLSDIDINFIYTAGMVADLYGNSEVSECKSSFKAYTGSIARYSENIYVEKDGKRILRFVKKGFPKVYVGIDAYVQDGKLVVDVINDSGDVIGTFTYSNFVGNNIEEYSKNYFDENNERLIEEDGKVMTIDGVSYDGYERLTGMYKFEALDYKIDTVINIGKNDITIEEGWKRFTL
ncbi:MAG TPA: hypothetical protein GXZ92_03315 [Clostridiales bacterium]|nr:hypothetical protein [Clostridiales bacterium]